MGRNKKGDWKEKCSLTLKFKAQRFAHITLRRYISSVVLYDLDGSIQTTALSI
jgi:hypothetical protein